MNSRGPSCTRGPFRLSLIQCATTAGEVVSLDLLTMTKKTWDNKGYMLVLVDQHTKFIAIFAFVDKKSAMQFVQTFVAFVC